MEHQAFFQYQPPSLDSPSPGSVGSDSRGRPTSSGIGANPSSIQYSSSSSRPGSSHTTSPAYTVGNASFNGSYPSGDETLSSLPPVYEGHLQTQGLMGPPSNPGMNIRNTRPMTAPGSVSAPYYQGGAYVVPNFDSQSYENAGGYPQTTMAGSGPSSYSQQESMLEGSLLRSRGLSLPELETLPPNSGLPDDPHYASSGNHHTSPSPFLHAPPPLRQFPYRRDEHDMLSAPPTAISLSSSRPTTADSRPDTATSIASSSGYFPSMFAPQGSHNKVYSFVSLPGTPKKRARRRYDEIERMYGCNYPGCTKAYGTLNHLNAHISMQKHGPKRTPLEFKEARKEWRARKKREDEQRSAHKQANSGRDGLSNGNGNGNQHPRPTVMMGAPSVFAIPPNGLRPNTAPSSYYQPPFFSSMSRRPSAPMQGGGAFSSSTPNGSSSGAPPFATVEEDNVLNFGAGGGGGGGGGHHHHHGGPGSTGGQTSSGGYVDGQTFGAMRGHGPTLGGLPILEGTSFTA